jgi:hypothetical protein
MSPFRSIVALCDGAGSESVFHSNAISRYTRVKLDGERRIEIRLLRDAPLGTLVALRYCTRHWLARSSAPQSLAPREDSMATEHREHSVNGHPYQRLIVMAVLSLVSMYFLMYAMVDRPSYVYGNLNQLFMAGLMTAPMVLIELIVMRRMYPDRTRNAVIALCSIACGVAMFLFIRQQTAIADEQFLRSMIPHHSGAILMCERAKLRNAQLRELCDAIIESQQEEITLMATMLQQGK